MATNSPWGAPGSMAAQAGSAYPTHMSGGPGYNAFMNEAQRQGPSPWLTLAKRQQQALESNAREKGMLDMAGQTAKARSDLAAGGGLSSGARERVAQKGIESFGAMSQGLSRQASLDNMELGKVDEQNRMQMMGQVPQLEAQRAKAINDYNMEMYKTQMESQAAERQAQATESSGKK